MIKHDEIKLHTVAGRASYHDLREDLVEITHKSGLKDGLMTITTPLLLVPFSMKKQCMMSIISEMICYTLILTK